MLPSPDSNLLGLPVRTPLAEPTTNTITAATAIVVRPKTQRLRTGRWQILPKLMCSSFLRPAGEGGMPRLGTADRDAESTAAPYGCGKSEIRACGPTQRWSFSTDDDQWATGARKAVRVELTQRLRRVLRTESPTGVDQALGGLHRPTPRGVPRNGSRAAAEAADREQVRRSSSRASSTSALRAHGVSEAEVGKEVGAGRCVLVRPGSARSCDSPSA